MLSYQHGYHAGNAADVHKHALLAAMLDYMTRKPKPLFYLETHAGRGLYDLAGEQARKTGEAEQGIGRMAARFAPDHPYARALASVRGEHGATAYPGSPMIAAHLLRETDVLHLAERHPAEHAVLAAVMRPHRARVHFRDGFELAQALTPPEPRRGLMLVDPSYETAEDYANMAPFLRRIARKWNVGVIVLWYPLLADARHAAMLGALEEAHPGALRHEMRFPPARPGHGMIGSGLFVINPPFGLEAEAARLARQCAALSH
ncbi:MAG: 23S rRNA (adenine2030-N6)-methyltransferase [Rhodobacteraceae bacterium HLUCCA12]|nr:MAG: 23S rRNA (adenine2030-N6)-methyltransferase [Rhodobacteraceae bacterium HLUCCA12]